MIFTSKKSIRSAVIFFTVFAIVFYYFYSRIKHYIPAYIEVDLETSFPNEIDVSWDTGNGFNELETKNLVFAHPPKKHLLKLTRSADKNPASTGHSICLSYLETDTQGEYDLATFEKKNSLEIQPFHGSKILCFNKNKSKVEFESTFHSLRAVFIANASSGIAELSIDDEKVLSQDLYSESHEDRIIDWKASEEPDTNAVSKLPIRTPITMAELHRIKIRSQSPSTVRAINIVTWNKRQSVSVTSASATEHIIDDVSVINYKTDFFLLTLQMILAAVVTVCILKAWPLISSKAALRILFLENMRPVFWIIFLASILSFTFWWLAFWPVALSPDSLFTWRTARSLNFYDDTHPYLNVIYVLVLRHLWDHPGVISLVQILCTATLGSWIFYRLSLRGVGIWWMSPFILYFVLSMPIGLYNIILWRDTVFALSMVFWAYYLVELKLSPERGKSLTIMTITVLALSLLCLMLRHNGKITLAFVPFAILFLRCMPIKKFLLFVGVLCGLYYFTQYTLKKDILKITFFYSPQISQAWSENLAFEKTPFQLGKTLSIYLTSLDLNHNKKTTNFWKPLWSDVKHSNNYSYNTNLEGGYIKYYSILGTETRETLESLLAQSYDSPWVYLIWNPFPFLYLYLVVIWLYRTFPMSAVYSSVILSQTFVLIYFTESDNWRYFYYLYLSTVFLVPMLLLDWKLNSKKLNEPAQTS